MRRWAIAQFPFGLCRREKHPVLRHVQAVYREERLLTGQLRHGFGCVRDRKYWHLLRRRRPSDARLQAGARPWVYGSHRCRDTRLTVDDSNIKGGEMTLHYAE
jgi:hypothetical protein